MLEIVLVVAGFLLAPPLFLWIGYVWGRSAHRKRHQKYRRTSGTITSRQMTFIKNLCHRNGLECPHDLSQYSMDEARALILDLRARVTENPDHQWR